MFSSARWTAVAVVLVVATFAGSSGGVASATPSASVSKRPLPTYTTNFQVRSGGWSRTSRLVKVHVSDDSCAADETLDSRERFVGITVRKARHAYLLTARMRPSPEWGEASTCEGNPSKGTTFNAVVRLPRALGDRGIIDSALGPSDFRFVLVPPVGARAIRSLVPRFIYSGTACDRESVHDAFRGRRKTDWCFF